MGGTGPNLDSGPGLLYLNRNSWTGNGPRMDLDLDLSLTLILFMPQLGWRWSSFVRRDRKGNDNSWSEGARCDKLPVHNIIFVLIFFTSEKALRRMVKEVRKGFK